MSVWRTLVPSMLPQHEKTVLDSVIKFILKDVQQLMSLLDTLNSSAQAIAAAIPALTQTVQNAVVALERPATGIDEHQLNPAIALLSQVGPQLANLQQLLAQAIPAATTAPAQTTPPAVTPLVPSAQ